MTGISQSVANWSQAVLTIAVIVTLIVYWRMLYAMGKQVEAARHASRGQNLFGLLQYLGREDFRESRAHLIRDLAATNLDRWTEDDRRRVEEVCMSFDLAGRLVELHLVLEGPLIEGMADRIAECHEASMKLIKEYRQQRNPRYWEGFDKLAAMAKKHLKSPASLPG
jgi:hypothetical protein